LIIIAQKGAKMTNIQILVNSGKFKRVEDILSNFDLVADMLKEDVTKTLAKAGIVATSIDDYYRPAVEIIKRNLNKKRHLSGIQKLFLCQDVEQGLKIILSKLRGYTHNNMLQSRKNSVAFWKKKYKNEVKAMDVIYDPLELLIAEEETAKEQFERAKQVRKNEISKFRKMVKNGEIKVSKTGCGNTQLCLSFY